jgi:hypothetical protein
MNMYLSARYQFAFCSLNRVASKNSLPRECFPHSINQLINWAITNFSRMHTIEIINYRYNYLFSMQRQRVHFNYEKPLSKVIETKKHRILRQIKQ